MTARPKTWKCPRRTCRHTNVVPKRKCVECGTARKIRRARHLTVLTTLSYEDFVELNGGEFCGVCLRPPRVSGRRLDRDHDHKTGKPRGLCCARCNRALPSWVTAEWLDAAAAYLRRAAA